MTFLILSILSSTGVLIMFRLIQRVQAYTLDVILMSYVVAALFGVLVFSPGLETISMPWFWPAAVEGAVFYVGFRLIAHTTQVNGVAVAGIATKMSVVIPIAVGIFFLGEALTPLKILGVMFGIVAVLLSASGAVRAGSIVWPLLAFVWSGMIDASLKLFQVWNVSEAQFPAFATTVFGFAFLTAFIHRCFIKGHRIHRNSALIGGILGVLNFGTVFFLLKALAQPSWDSSIIYPINNFGVVAMSTIVAILVFRERLQIRGWIGLGLAVASIGVLFQSAA